ncbi:MAG: CopG family ribbon-helix-helix protein [Candidatus Thermoplasmatota archaeon]|nr:CopG family ribbon-helix-helix protein [Candidatus Thermoplasmatota archaeon]
MPIVSVSLTEKNLDVLDRMQRALGLSGRSEAVRACLRTAEDEIRDREVLTGNVEGVLMIVHESHRDWDLDDIRHSFQGIITTQIHSHLRNEKCLEVFIVNGDSATLKEMIFRFRGKDELDYVKFIRS